MAAKEKHKLEEAQRARRKEHEKAGTHHLPAFFDEIETAPNGKGHSSDKQWKFNGKYWQDRESQNWEHLVDIYNIKTNQ